MARMVKMDQFLQSGSKDLRRPSQMQETSEKKKKKKKHPLSMNLSSEITYITHGRFKIELSGNQGRIVGHLDPQMGRLDLLHLIQLLHELLAVI